VLLVACAVAAGCSGEPGVPIFGTEDTACVSTQLANEESDQAKLAEVVDCLRSEIAAGRPVTVDIVTPTGEGDPIYHRYAYDGERVLIVTDSRADEFGRGTVEARLCRGLRATQFLPQEIDCSRTSADGFPEADR